MIVFRPRTNKGLLLFHLWTNVLLFACHTYLRTCVFLAGPIFQLSVTLTTYMFLYQFFALNFLTPIIFCLNALNLFKVSLKNEMDLLGGRLLDIEKIFVV